MPKPPTTKELLLESACQIFAEKGFREATVAEICEAAGANIAAVNYHFGDKEKLYDAVWHCAFLLSTQTYPLEANLPENPSIEDYLHGYASAILHRIFSEDKNGLFAKLLHREMASPTLALGKIAKDYLVPQSQHITRVVEKVLGTDGDEALLALCRHSIIGQCAFYNFSRPLRQQMIGRETMTEQEIDRTARHIARFSLGGLNAIKECL